MEKQAYLAHIATHTDINLVCTSVHGCIEESEGCSRTQLDPRKSGGATYGHSLGMYEHKFPLQIEVECRKSKSSAESRRRRRIKKAVGWVKVKKEI